MEQEQNVVSLSKLSLPALSAVIFTTWLALWAVAMLMEYAPHASIWLPPAGLSFAFLFAFGWRAIPGIMLAIFVTGYFANLLYGSNQTMPETFTGSFLFAISHIGLYGIAAYVLKQLFNSTTSKSLVIKVLWFLTLGSLGAFLAAVAGIQSLILSEAVVVDSFMEILLPWWVGDMAGVLIVSPIVLALLSTDHSEFKSSLNIDANRSEIIDGQSIFLKNVVAVVLLGTTMAVATWIDSPAVALLIFLVGLPMVWIVKSEPSIVSGITLVVLSFFTAFFVDIFGVMNFALVYQFALIFMACVTWIVLASHKDQLHQGSN